MTDTRTHFVVFETEKDHPLSKRDPRNLWVQHNYKLADCNKVNPHFKTEYRKAYSPKKK